MAEADLYELTVGIVKMLTTTDFYEGIEPEISEIGKNFGYLAHDFIDMDTTICQITRNGKIDKSDS